MKISKNKPKNIGYLESSMAVGSERAWQVTLVVLSVM